MNIALETHLKPLMPFFSKDGVTEICINKPEEVFVEEDGVFTRHAVSELEYPFLETLAGLIAEDNGKDYPAPLLSGSLPGGLRAQLVMSPGCEKDRVVCSIRRKQMIDMTLDDYDRLRAFAEIEIKQKSRGVPQRLIELYHKKDWKRFIREAVLAKKNILISGGTGTGKTTFLNACLKEVPQHERILTVEDTREVMVDQPNAAHLLFNEDDQCISALEIFRACLRLRPDRIFLSELRGAEVWSYLRAANSGHPGSLSTVHADSPAGAFQQLVFMMQERNSTSTVEELDGYIRSVINIVVQLKRDEPESDRFMHVSEVYFDAAEAKQTS